MPIARFQMPDGRIARFEVPDGTTPEQAQAMIQNMVAPPAQQNQHGTLGNAAAGFAHSGMNLVSNLMRPLDYLTGDSAEARMKGIDDRLKAQGYDPQSIAFKGGGLAGDIAATAPVGGILAKGVEAVPALAKAIPNLAMALRSGGFKVAQPAVTTSGKLGNALTRVGAGAATGGVMAGMVDPENAATGATWGALMPVGVKVAGETGNLVADKAIKPMARSLMQSAIKPTIKDLKSGRAATAVQTLLDYGISPNAAGVEKIGNMIDDLNTQIGNKLAGSKAMINKNDVIAYLKDPLESAMSQVDPAADVNAVKRVGDSFMNHPSLPNDSFPVQAAQRLKTGTYSAIKKQYGQRGSAEIEAQKALARGLKDEVSKAIPGIADLNSQESRLLDTLKVSERRALMELNKNPVGLSALTQNPKMFALFMADRSAAFKALAARMINRSASVPQAFGNADKLLANPAVRAGLLDMATSGNP